jgi:hypothetical protein
MRFVRNLTLWFWSGYVPSMKAVSVANLKNDLSRYLRVVGEGEEVLERASQPLPTRGS